MSTPRTRRRAAAPTSGTRCSGKNCRCKRHNVPHCLCRLDRKKPPPPPPIKTPQPRTQIEPYFNLNEVAYIIGSLIGVWLTPLQIAGAMRALGLRNDATMFKAIVRGCAIYRQQTMVHRTRLQSIGDYICGKLGLSSVKVP